MTATEVDAALADAARRRRRSASTIALACHVNPDGDALGSMLGLFHVLRAAGRDVVASFPPPFMVAPHYRELPGLELLTHPDEFPREPDVMVTFDCGSLGRLGDLEPAAKAARELIVLDHHVSNTRYGTINVIDPGGGGERRDRPPARTRARTAAHRRRRGRALRRARLRHRPVPVRDHHAATSSTSPASSSPSTSPSRASSRQLFEEHRFAYLKLLGEALAAAELDVERRFVWTAVTQDMLTRHGVTLEEVEGLIDIVRRTTEAEVTCVVKEEPDGSVRVSLRSLGDVDVRLIAADNGGGGHRFAAGFESTLDIPAVVAKIRDAL